MTKPDLLTPVVGPLGQAEDFFWVVQYRSGELAAEHPSQAWSRTVRHADVLWLAIQPQRVGLMLHRVRVPDSAAAWFMRRRTQIGLLGVPGSERYESTWTGIGWRYPDGSGPSLLFNTDGTSVSGTDDLTLTEAL